MGKYEGGKVFLPSNYTELCIEGGNEIMDNKKEMAVRPSHMKDNEIQQ